MKTRENCYTCEKTMVSLSCHCGKTADTRRELIFMSFTDL